MPGFLGQVGISAGGGGYLGEVAIVGGVAPTTLPIGTPITGGGANRVLYENAALLLATHAAFTFDDATQLLSVQDVTASNNMRAQNYRALAGQTLNIIGDAAAAVYLESVAGLLQVVGADQRYYSAGLATNPLRISAGLVTYNFSADGSAVLFSSTYADWAPMAAPAAPAAGRVRDYAETKAAFGRTHRYYKDGAGVEYMVGSPSPFGGMNVSLDPAATLYPAGITTLTTAPASSATPGARAILPQRWTIPGKPPASTTTARIVFIFSDGSEVVRSNPLAPPLTETADSFFWGKNGPRCVSVSFRVDNVGAPVVQDFGLFNMEGWVW